MSLEHFNLFLQGMYLMGWSKSAVVVLKKFTFVQNSNIL